jgi:hypothetical protein
MKFNGFRKSEKITLYESKVLDGRHRLQAAELSGEKPTFETFIGTQAEALAFVIDKNFHRRHLSSSQRSVIAAEIATRKNSETSIAEAAEKMHVSRDSVQTAVKIKKKSEKLAKKVKAGKISLNAAEKKISKPTRARERAAIPTADFYSSAPASTEQDKRSIGQICMEAYVEKLGAKSKDKWEKVSDKEKSAWLAAAEAVKGRQ